MKKGLLVLSLFTFISLNPVFSQDNESADKLVFDISFDNWIQDIDEIKTYVNSFGFNFYFMYDIPLGKSRMSFAPGLGFSTSFVKNNAKITETDSGTVFIPYLNRKNTDYVRHKNSLVTVYFDVPLELRYRAKPNDKGKSFKLALGVKQGVLVDGHTKRKFEHPIDSDKNKKEKLKNFVDLSRFRFGPVFRIGYGSVNFFAYYGVIGLFKQDDGPEINTWSAGISISGL